MAQTLEELRESLRERPLNKTPEDDGSGIRGHHIDAFIIDDPIREPAPPPVVMEALNSKLVTVYRVFDSDGHLREELCPELPEGSCYGARSGEMGECCGGCDACLLAQSEVLDGRTTTHWRIEKCQVWVPENARSLWR